MMRGYSVLLMEFYPNHFGLIILIKVFVSLINQIKIRLSIYPLFLMKKIIDYSVLDSLGGPTISQLVRKINKITTLINEYLYVLKI